MPDDEKGFELKCTPRKTRKSGPNLDTRIVRSGDAMLKIIESYDVDLTDLAAVAMIDLSVASRRVKQAKERRERCPVAEKLTAADLRYMSMRYRDAKDPSVREFLKGINTRRRRRA